MSRSPRQDRRLPGRLTPGDAARLLKRFRAVLARATRRWLHPRISLFAAALAFHALLALAPVLLLLVSVADRLLGQEEVRSGLAEAAMRFAGAGADRVALTLLDLVVASRWQGAATFLGAALLLFFASSFFLQLRAAFDGVWEIRPKGFGGALLDRLRSLGETLVAVMAGLLVLAASVLRSVVWPVLARAGAAGALAWTAWTRIGTLLIIFIVLAAAFRYLPSVRPRPGSGAILAGAIPAALILNLASDLFGLVITRSALASLYGAAGSVIVFLLWVYYSAWIVLLGAEVCRAWDEPVPEGGSPPGRSR